MFATWTRGRRLASTREEPMTEQQVSHSDRDADSAVASDSPRSDRSSASESTTDRLAELRLLAVKRDAALCQSFDLSRLWLELCRGTWRFRDTFPSEDRYIALI